MVKVQTVLRLVVTVAGLAQPAAVAIKQLWETLDEDGRLTDQTKRLLESLRRAASTPDPVDKLRRSLGGVQTYLDADSDVPDEQSASLRARVRECQRRLDLADSLSGAERRTVLKAVKGEVSDLVRVTLTLGVDEPHGPVAAPTPRRRRSAPRVPLRRHRSIERR